jgi:hypothetical protein
MKGLTMSRRRLAVGVAPEFVSLLGLATPRRRQECPISHLRNRLGTKLLEDSCQAKTRPGRVD